MRATARRLKTGMMGKGRRSNINENKEAVPGITRHRNPYSS
jgi:hypothetical protein